MDSANSGGSGGLRQMNLFLRTKSDSGKKLSDEVSTCQCQSGFLFTSSLYLFLPLLD